MHSKGSLDLPSLPGLGFEIDERALRRYGQRFFVADKLRVAIRAVRDRGLSNARHLGELRDARLASRSQELDRRFSAGEGPVGLALADVGVQP